VRASRVFTLILPSNRLYTACHTKNEKIDIKMYGSLQIPKKYRKIPKQYLYFFSAHKNNDNSSIKRSTSSFSTTDLHTLLTLRFFSRPLYAFLLRRIPGVFAELCISLHRNLTSPPIIHETDKFLYAKQCQTDCVFSRWGRHPLLFGPPLVTTVSWHHSRFELCVFFSALVFFIQETLVLASASLVLIGHITSHRR